MDQRTVGIAVGLWLVAFTGIAAAQESGQGQAATLRVFVMNQAGIRPEVLHAAEADAAEVFAAAGVRVVWLDRTTAASERIDLTVKIAAGMKASMLPRNVTDLALGFAAVKESGDGLRGHLVWVFADEVEVHAGHHHIQSSRLCGLVMAHEIGHLVLPAGHSESGLMRATWDLRSGLLQHFTDAQADAIQARLAYAQARTE